MPIKLYIHFLHKYIFEIEFEETFVYFVKQFRIIMKHNYFSITFKSLQTFIKEKNRSENKYI